VFEVLKTNAETSRHIAATILDELVEAVSDEKNVADSILSEEMGSMKFSIMPRSNEQKLEDLEKLSFILPQYFREES
jgi:5'-methylthioadenosine phosphorylase